MGKEVSVKEQIIKKSIKEVERKLKKVNEIWDFDLIGELDKVQEKFKKDMEDPNYNSIKAYKEWVEGKKKVLKMVKKSSSDALCNKKAKLEFELSELKKELFKINFEK